MIPYKISDSLDDLDLTKSLEDEIYDAMKESHWLMLEKYLIETEGWQSG